MIRMHRVRGGNQINYQTIEDLVRDDTSEASVNLNPIQATPSAIQNYLLRHWHYTNFAARFAFVAAFCSAVRCTFALGLVPAASCRAALAKLIASL